MKAKIINYLPPLGMLIFILWMVVQADLDQTNPIIDIGHSVPHGDKIGHFLLFGLLALLLNSALEFRTIQLCSRTFHLGSILVFLFAICEECSQLAFETRNFDIIDMLFDLFGIGLLSSISCRRFIVQQLKSLTKYLGRRLLVN